MDLQKLFKELDVKAQTGIYILVSLVAENKKDVICPFNRPLKSDFIKRYNYLKTKILKKENIDNGIYYLEFKSSAHKNAVKDIYEIEISENTLPEILEIEVLKNTQKQNNNMDLSLDKYLIMITENANLKAQVSLLEQENAILKEQLEEIENENEGLSEGPATNYFQPIIDQLPLLLGGLDKHFSLKEKELQLKELALRNGLVERNKINDHLKAMPKRQKMTPSQNISNPFLLDKENLINYSIKLQQSNPEKFEEFLDKLEQVDNDKYLLLCNDLGIEFDNENDEEND